MKEKSARRVSLVCILEVIERWWARIYWITTRAGAREDRKKIHNISEKRFTHLNARLFLLLAWIALLETNAQAKAHVKSR